MVNRRACPLELPGDTARLSGFYARLDSLLLFGHGRINIVHIGGSHVQADGLSNRLRMNFAALQPNAATARGAIFPWSAARTNAPANITTTNTGAWTKTQNSLGRMERPLGIMGYNVTTTDTAATISFDLNPAGQQWRYCRLRLFAEMNDSVIRPLLAVGRDTFTALRTADSYVFDLPREASTGTVLFRHTADTIYNNVSAGPISVLGLIPENDRDGIVFHSLGVNGASLPSWLKCERFDDQIRYIAPDLVILGVGINDANVPVSKFDPEVYKAQYRRLLDKIYAVNPRCAVIFITNNDCVLRLGRRGRGVNRNTPRVEQALRELAREQGAAVWNQFEVMGGLGSSPAWVSAGLMNHDRIHFTAEGYNLLGNLMFDAIMELYDEVRL